MKSIVNTVIDFLKKVAKSNAGATNPMDECRYRPTAFGGWTPPQYSLTPSAK